MTIAMLSNLSRGVTDGIIYVDSGYNIIGQSLQQTVHMVNKGR